MDYTASEVLQFISENDVKFIRLAFCDVFGAMKNISIMASQLSRAFESGISFDASAIPGFMNVENSDLFLFPDPKTMSILPWRSQQGHVIRLFCTISHPDGTPFEGDGRVILQSAIAEAAAEGYECKCGPECEFYLFEADEHGRPTKRPHDRGTYFDVYPYDKGENVRREICLTLLEMGFLPEASHHEQGPGQHEISFQYGDPLSGADNLSTFKTVVRTVAAQHGLFASFMPKPLLAYSGSGLHINLSIYKNGVNLMRDAGQQEAGAFLAGVLKRIAECSIFSNPLTNSYARLGTFEAPKHITWSKQNRSPLVRIPAAHGDYSRFEVRSPDPSCNPYLVIALLIRAGLSGIREKMSLPPASDFDLYQASEEALANIPALPATLQEAIGLAQDSAFLPQALPQRTIDTYLAAARSQWDAYRFSVNKEKHEEETYFSLV